MSAITDDNNVIRPYGPGKFNTILDSYVYSMSLDGTDEELGESDSFGWYGMLTGPITPRNAMMPKLNSAELTLLATCAGIILSENSQGFVTVEYYDDLETFNKEWTGLEKAWIEVNAPEEDYSDEN